MPKTWTPHIIDGKETTKDNAGYVRVRYPEHPNSRNGYVARGRLVLENKLERFLDPSEHVWRDNEVRDDDQPENLSLSKKRRLPIIKCPICGKQFQQKNARNRHCSAKCGAISTHRCRHPNANALQWMVWDRPTMDVAAYYGVSDVAVAKWCKRLGVVKPGRGYWAKVHAGVVRHVNPYPKPKQI